MADELDLDEIRAHALTTIGMAKNDVERRAAECADMERALEIALEAGSPRRLLYRQQPRRRRRSSPAIFRARTSSTARGCGSAERFGDRRARGSSGATSSASTSSLGRLGPRARAADEFIAECEAGRRTRSSTGTRSLRAHDASGPRRSSTAHFADHERAVELGAGAQRARHSSRAPCGYRPRWTPSGHLDEARARRVQSCRSIRENGLHGYVVRLAAYRGRLGIDASCCEAARRSRAPMRSSSGGRTHRARSRATSSRPPTSCRGRGLRPSRHTLR